MTIGIYALYWEEQDLMYIGQSINIEGRTKSHIKSMFKNTHFNLKVQNTFNIYGEPKVCTIEKCSIDMLDYLERLWINEFNTHINGLNLTIGGKSLRGELHPKSLHSNKIIEDIFKTLISKHMLSQRSIANQYGVTLGIVKSIAQGVAHSWLQELYPIEWNKLTATTRRLKSINTFKNGLTKTQMYYCN